MTVNAGATVDVSAKALTGPDDWDTYWRAVFDRLPQEAVPGEQSSTTEILSVLDRFLVAESPLSVLEIGGAPGGYLVHLWRRFGHHVCVLDSSPVGIDATRQNFDLLGVPGRTLQRDMFATEPPRERFDVVYSLGLIEHFEDTAAAIGAHLGYLKPGGRLIIGCPNLRGVNGALMHWLSPSVYRWHQVGVMDLRSWAVFERSLQLTVRFRAYIGGFQPAAFWRCDRRSLLARASARGFGTLGRHWNGPLARILARVNSRHWSYYAIGVYDVPNPALGGTPSVACGS